MTRFQHGVYVVRAACLLFALTLPSSARADPLGGGGFLSFEVEMTWVNGGLGVVGGVSGGYRSADGLTVGLGLYDLLNGTRVATDESVRTKMHWAGVLVGKQWNVDGEWAVGLTLLLGGGDVSHYRTAKKDAFDRSWYLLAEPRVGVWSPRAGSFDAGAAAGYRWVPVMWRGGGAVDSLSGPQLTLSGSIVDL